MFTICEHCLVWGASRLKPSCITAILHLEKPEPEQVILFREAMTK